MSPMAPLRPCKQYGCPERVAKGYCAAHQSVDKKHKQEYDRNRGSSAARGYGYHWREVTRPAILARDPICVYGWVCGGRSLSTVVDHIIPKSQGGTDEHSNLAGCCQPDHSYKTRLEEDGLPLPERVSFVIP